MSSPKFKLRGLTRFLRALLLLHISSCGVAAATENSNSKYSILFASYVHHFYPRNSGQTEEFDNWFFAVTKEDSTVPWINRIVIGTLRNSRGNQCLLLGGIKEWRRLGYGTTIKGMYAYVGEFVGGTFPHCGDNGIYKDIKEKTGVGFAPYIYHGIEHRLSDHVFINGGLILPGVTSFALEVKW